MRGIRDDKSNARVAASPAGRTSCRNFRHHVRMPVLGTESRRCGRAHLSIGRKRIAWNPPAFRGGAATAALGLFLHYFIATSMSFTYYLVAQRWAALRERPLPYGAAYGLLLYGIMNYIVVPLSRARGGGSGGTRWITLSIVVHMLLIGVPIAWFTAMAFRECEARVRMVGVGQRCP